MEWRPSPPNLRMPPWDVRLGEGFLNTCILKCIPSPTCVGFSWPTLGHSLPKLGWLGLPRLKRGGEPSKQVPVYWGRETLDPRPSP